VWFAGPNLALCVVRRSGTVGKHILSVRPKNDPCSRAKKSLFLSKKIPVPEAHGSPFGQAVEAGSSIAASPSQRFRPFASGRKSNTFQGPTAFSFSEWQFLLF